MQKECISTLFRTQCRRESVHPSGWRQVSCCCVFCTPSHRLLCYITIFILSIVLFQWPLWPPCIIDNLQSHQLTIVWSFLYIRVSLSLFIDNWDSKPESFKIKSHTLLWVLPKFCFPVTSLIFSFNICQMFDIWAIMSGVWKSNVESKQAQVRNYYAGITNAHWANAVVFILKAIT